MTLFQNVLSSFSQLKDNKNKNQENWLNSCSRPDTVPGCPYPYPRKRYELGGDITAFQEPKFRAATTAPLCGPRFTEAHGW